ncbi:MAG TPA: DNA ligase [Candidatus Aenigmarchaeota archaeon]|nr:DNA ligase [Candidatus Aenigmarchaeota archaeon]
MKLWDTCIRPMLAKKAKPFDSDAWIFEPKWDGTRCIAFIDCEKKYIRLQNRRLLDITNRYPELKLFEDCDCKKAILDGEIVVLKHGRPDFYRLQEREHQEDIGRIKLISRVMPAVYMVFDILFFNGKELLHVPLIERKDLLDRVVSDSKRMVKTMFIDTYGKRFFESARKKGLEGIMAKYKASSYEIGKRSSNWLKIKASNTMDCIICGYTLGHGKRSRYFGSLVLGCYKDGKLVHIGDVGTGWDEDTMKYIHERLKRIETKQCPFKEFEDTGKRICWVKPSMVCEVEFLELTPQLKLRAPSFKRLREDKIGRECIIEY